MPREGPTSLTYENLADLQISQSKKKDSDGQVYNQIYHMGLTPTSAKIESAVARASAITPFIFLNGLFSKAGPWLHPSYDSKGTLCFFPVRKKSPRLNQTLTIVHELTRYTIKANQ